MFEVNKTEDTYDGLCSSLDCSLRDAVSQANLCPGTQTIYLPAGIYRLTRAADGLEGDDAVDVSVGDLDVTDNVVIEARGEMVVIDGNNAHRVFQIAVERTRDPETGEPLGADLRGLTVMKGRAERGGGIYVQRGHLLLQTGPSDFVIRASRAAQGGAIYVGGDGSLSAGNAVYIEKNVASAAGGGIYVAPGGHIVFNGTIIGNQVLDGPGGGLYLAGSGSISGARINGNRAAGPGAGVFSNGSLDILETEVRYNYGEAVVNAADGNLNIYRSVVGESQGTVRSGPVAVANAGRLIVRESQIRGGTATDSAGRRFGTPGIDNTGDLRVEDTTVAVASGVTGEVLGIQNLAVASVTRSILKGGSALNRVPTEVEDIPGLPPVPQMTLTNVTITGNRGLSEASAAVINQEGRLRLEHVTLYGNLGRASAVRNEGGELIVKNSLLAGNGGPACRGTGIVSEGGNLFGDASCPATPADLVVGPGTDLGLLPLGDYGGFTETYALAAGSPALDLIEPPCLATDQRGVARPQGEACDAGAYEAEGRRAAVEVTPPPTPTVLPPIEINFNADRYSLKIGECTKLRWEVKNAEQVSLDGQPVPPLEAEDVCPQQTTTYSLRARNAAEEAEELVTIEVVEPRPPRAPVGLQVAKWVCNQKVYRVTLEWEDRADNEKGYRVYRDGALIATLGPNAESYTDTPPYGGPYTYGVETFNEDGASSRPTVQEQGCFQ